ncbi:MAG: helix-turn-helix domain-containing protein [Saprospiraceae bacterium]|nr:helix-turn-helix domain-containing protein [Saprospiraceae bacterium]
MMASSVSTLINPQNGNLAFKIFSFEDNSHFDHLQRHNYYTIIILKAGAGTLKADLTEYELKAPTMLCFSTYQPYMIQSQRELKGWVIHFHSDFFCIHKHHKEVACNGVLFNNIYEPPFLSLDEKTLVHFEMLTEQMKTEMQHAALAQYELLVSYLKIFLITASRLKAEQHPAAQQEVADNKEPFILQTLKDAIEQHYKTKHSASDYAALLNISAKALAKISKTYFNKTLTDLIAERIIIEAKRELYLSSKAVKEIAYELGFHDEYYFSRFFKNNADISPQGYRDTVGFARAEV